MMRKQTVCGTTRYRLLCDMVPFGTIAVKQGLNCAKITLRPSAGE
jgi:hypothetical protein